MEKKKYLVPNVEIFPYGAELMQVIATSPTGADQEAKKADLFFHEDDDNEDNTAETGSLWDEPMWQ